MKCPKDGTELQPVTVAGVQLDKCHRCDGIWCDRGEMERLREVHRESVEEELEAQYGNPEYREGSPDGYMRCPRCDDGRLQGVTITYTSNVRVDRCDTCLGVWLDKRELDLVIRERVNARVSKPETGTNESSDINDDHEPLYAVFFHRLGRFFQG